MKGAAYHRRYFAELAGEFRRTFARILVDSVDARATVLQYGYFKRLIRRQFAISFISSAQSLYLTHVADAVVVVDRAVLAAVSLSALASVAVVLIDTSGAVLARVELFGAELDLFIAVISCRTERKMKPRVNKKMIPNKKNK